MSNQIVTGTWYAKVVVCYVQSGCNMLKLWVLPIKACWNCCWGALPPGRPGAPCAIVNKSSCSLHLLDWLTRGRGSYSLNALCAWPQCREADWVSGLLAKPCWVALCILSPFAHRKLGLCLLSFVCLVGFEAGSLYSPGCLATSQTRLALNTLSSARLCLLSAGI